MLVCAVGFSTSFVIQKMKAEAEKRELDVEILSGSINMLVDHIHEIDLVLVAPQVMYMEEEVKNLCNEKNIPWSPIESTMYGRMDGEGLLNLALSLIE
jgi:PTS system cellobiose-specific IIB component